jgi:PAS domain S-box-containing protein
VRVFRDLSISYKLTLLLLGVVAAVLLVVSMANVISSMQLTRATMAAKYSTLANIVAAESGAALSIADIDASGSQQIVSDLAIEPSIRFAALFDTAGKEVVRYPADEPSKMRPPEALGTAFTQDGFLDVVQEVKLNDGAVIGRIYLRADTQELRTRILRTIVISIAVFLLALAFALLLSLALQRFISMPILQLARVMQQVSTEHNYSLRASKRGNDELGALCDGFNTMLAEIRRRDDELERHRLRLEEVIESAPNAMVMVNQEGRVVLINSQTERLFGCTREELLGQPVELLVPQRFREVHPGYRKGYFANPQVRAMGMGRDLFGQRKDGSEFPVEIGLNPIQTEEGLFVLAAIVDITERKRAENERRASEERFHAVIENMTEGIVISDLDGQLLHCNRAALDLHGFANSKEWRRRLPEFVEFFEFSTLDDQIVSLEDWPLSRLLRGERLRNYEVRIRRRDTGTQRIFSYGGDIVLDGTGRQVAFLTMIDITERRQAEEVLRQAHEELERRVVERTSELAAANKELEAFSYSVSHDLRAPLRAIDGFSRILLDEHAVELSVEAQEYLRDVRGNAQQMGHLVDDLLAFSRLSRQPIKSQQVSPQRIVSQCLKELQREQGERNLEVQVGDLPVCSGDPSLLKQVWSNLLSNAFKYTGRREVPAIEVGSREGDEPGQRTYFVKDNGVGFDMRYAHKLFGVFQRLHRTEDYAGTGVGLAIVQRIVHRHGGRVWAEAQPGQGATFYFTLQNDGAEND